MSLCFLMGQKTSFLMKTYAKARLPSKQIEYKYQIGTRGFLCWLCFPSEASDQVAGNNTGIRNYSDQGIEISYPTVRVPFAVTAQKI